MIDLPAIWRTVTTGSALVFLLLWQVAERNERTALAIAAESVETARQCVATYKDSTDSMGAAVRSLLGVAE